MKISLMKSGHHLLSAFLITLSFLSAHSQKLVPCNIVDEQTKVKKWGFCDCFYSDIIIKCQYDTTFEFTQGLGRIRQNGKYGYVDKTGKMVIPVRYDGAEAFSEGFAPVALGGKVFFIDKKGIDVFNKTFKSVSAFSNGLAMCSNESGKRGFIDTKGNAAIPFTMEAAYSFKNGLAPVRFDGEKSWKAINTKGEVVFTFSDKVKSVLGPFSDGLVQVYVDGPAGYNAHYDFVNEKGEFICDAPYASAQPFKNGRAIVARENKNRSSGNLQFLKYGLIKKGGRDIVPAQYACLEESPIPGIYFYGAASSSISNCSGYGLLDSMGKEITQPKYSTFTRLNDSTFLCKEAGKYESLNQYLLLMTKGKELLSLKHRKRYFEIAGADTLLILYSEAVITGGTVTTVYNIHTGLLKENYTNSITIFAKQKLLLFSDWQSASGVLMTAAGKVVIDKIQTHIPYDYSISLGKMSCILVRRSDEKDFRLYNMNTGKYVTGDFGFQKEGGFHYSNKFSEGLLAAKQKGKWGFIDSTGKFKIPALYESVEDFHGGWAAVGKKEKGEDGNDYMVYINKAGKEIPGIKADFLKASDFSEGIAYYQKPYESHDRAVCYINNAGKVIFKSESDDFYKHGKFSNGLAAVPDKNGQYGYINTKGQLVIPYRFSLPSGYGTAIGLEFDNKGYARVKKDGLEIIIDKTGNQVK